MISSFVKKYFSIFCARRLKIPFKFQKSGKANDVSNSQHDEVTVKYIYIDFALTDMNISWFKFYVRRILSSGEIQGRSLGFYTYLISIIVNREDLSQKNLISRGQSMYELWIWYGIIHLVSTQNLPKN